MTKILIIDDAYFVRVKLRGCIESEGYTVVEAENGVEALKVYEAENPDLIFCDVTMPEMDGIETLKKLREMNPKVKVVMLTSVGEQTVLMDALNSGAKNFIVKPFDENKVLEVIKTLLNL